MQTIRLISPAEINLIQALARVAASVVDLSDIEGSEVTQMDDGGMGSFVINPDQQSNEPLIVAAAADGRDEDGVQVCITLYVDGSGRPREVDVWKVNFQPLIQLPASEDLMPAPPPASE